jgi:hypothetical protein
MRIQKEGEKKQEREINTPNALKEEERPKSNERTKKRRRK